VERIESVYYNTETNLLMQTSLRRYQFWGNESENSILVFFLICIVGVESKLGPLGTSATYWPIVPAPAHLVHHKSHLTRPGIEPGPPRWEASD
jgi:hypothetical protein